MKAYSERVKNKNIRDLCGKPLFYYILETLQECDNVEKIIVDTDSDIIKEKINSDFEKIIVLDRPEELRGGHVPMNSIIAHDLKHASGDYFLQTHSTNPLLKPQTIDESIELFLKRSEHDSLFSVNKILKRCYDSKGNPINHDLKIMERTQDLTPIYEENSCIFLFTRKSFELDNNRVGKTPYLFEIGKEESMDIDDEFDFELVKSLISIRKSGTC
jgi:CMP-N-acetylneuraminic acid synthetase